MFVAVSDQQVENFFDKLVRFLIEFFGKLFDGIIAVFDALPTIVIGGIFFFIGVVWLWSKAR